MLELMLTALAGAAALLFLYYLRHVSKNRGHLETLPFPVIPPAAMGLLGSPPTYDAHKLLFHQFVLDRFKTLNTKTFSSYTGVVPTVTTIDPELLKSILVKNFDCFTDIADMKVDDRHLTMDLSGGDKWRDLRKNLSPTFTSGRLKGMLEPMDGVAEDMMRHVEGKVLESGDGVVDLKQVFQGLAINIICRCAFGVEGNAFTNPDQDLIKYGRQVFGEFRVTNAVESSLFMLFFLFPGIERIMPLWPPAFDKVLDIAKDILEQRTRQNVKLNDFMDRLAELKKTRAENPDGEYLRNLSDDSIMAQCVVFFVAGFETTASTLTTTCYNLAKNPQVQDRVFEEVEEVLEVHGGKLDHETISDMEYLEAVINEDLRILPPAILHVRSCVKDCEVLPGVVIKKGTKIELPIYASHHHPDFFPDPDEFRPERFLKQNSGDVVPYTYRPFGGGPRLCIGQRFAMVEMKVALAHMLARYRLVAVDRTKLEPQTGNAFLLGFEDMYIKLEKRDSRQ